MLINVAHALPESRANGPGVRAALWVQGCSQSCAGCCNPAFQPPEPRLLCSPEDMAARLLSRRIRGLTLTGGEPFEQSAALVRLCRMVRAAGKDVVAFSGFTYGQLADGIRPFATQLLAEIDLLVDGPFVQRLRCDEPLRGSSNQQLHFLSDRIQSHELARLPRGEWILGPDDGTVSGFGFEAFDRFLER